ncbi:MAG: hypothetical protein V4558_08940 [Gemmatimonadota bacterium]
MRRIFGFAFLIITATASAQSPAQRAWLDSATASAPQCNSGTGSLKRLCGGLAAVRRAAATGDASEASKSLLTFERAVLDDPTWPLAWYGLGLARVQAARAKLIAHEGALQPLGMSFEAGAGFALIRALTLDVSYLPAAEALALISIPREGASRLVERIAMLRKLRPRLTGTADYSAAQVELNGGDPDSATAFLHDALQRTDIDSGVVLLALARSRYAAKDPVDGRKMLIRGARDSASASRAAYAQELSWVATPTELREWDSLPSAARADWLTAFWNTRDVSDGHEDGARLIEHYRRFEYAMKNYTLQLPRTGKHQISRSSMAGDYIDLDAVVRDVGHDADTSAAEAGITEMAASKRFSGTGAGLAQFRSLTVVFDDRGVVYIRQGPPDQFARTVGGKAIEGWRYDRDGGTPLVLYFKEEDFDGQAGASTLTPEILSSYPQERDQLCQLEPGDCTFSADPRVTTLATGRDVASPRSGSPQSRLLAGAARTTSTARVAAAATRGKANIDTVTTTDRFARKFPHQVEPVVQLLSVRQAVEGTPRLLVVFAIPGDQLASLALAEAGGRTGYPVHFVVSAARHGDGRRFVMDTIRNFATPHPLKAGEFLSGMLELPIEPGDYTGSLLISQQDGRGAVARLGRITVIGSRQQLAISDVVLGVAGSKTHWNSGSSEVSLNPMNAFSSGGEAELYGQLSGMKSGQDYVLTFEVFRADDAVGKKPRLAISFPQTARDGLVEIQRSVGLKSLDPGRYRVKVAIAGAGESAFAMTVLTVVK